MIDASARKRKPFGAALSGHRFRAYTESVRSVWIAFCSILVACGGGSAVASGARPRAEEDPAVALVALLPRGATACQATRLDRMPASRRSTAAALAVSSVAPQFNESFPLLSPLVWLPELGVEAVASATRAADMHAGGSVTLLRVQVTREEALRVLSTQRVERLIVDARDMLTCNDAECVASAGRVSFPDDHIVRITRGFWDGQTPGLEEPDCASVLASEPNAFSVWAESYFEGAFGTVAVVTLTEERLVTRIEAAHGSTPDPEAFEAFLQGRTRLHAQLVRGIRWEDLAFMAGDNERRRAALAEAQQGNGESVPVADVDVSDEAEFRLQYQLRLQQGSSNGAAELVQLCSRRFAVAPWDEFAARALVGAYGQERNYAELVAVADRATNEGGLEFRADARAALSILDVNRFADRLVADGFLTRTEARPFVSWLRSEHIAATPSFPIDPLTAVAEFRANTRMQMTPLSTPIPLDVAFAVPLLAQLSLPARQGEREEQQIAVRVSTVLASERGTDDDPYFDPALPTADGDSPAWFAGDESVRFYSVGERIADLVRGPAFQLTAYLVSRSGRSHPVGAFSISRASSGAWVLDAVSTSWASRDWPRIASRYFAPLWDVRGQTFPLPQIHLVVTDEVELADTMQAFASLHATCSAVRPLELQCEVFPESFNYVAAILANSVLAPH